MDPQIHRNITEFPSEYTREYFLTTHRQLLLPRTLPGIFPEKSRTFIVKIQEPPLMDEHSENVQYVLTY